MRKRLIGLLAAFVLVACGGGAEDSSTPTPYILMVTATPGDGGHQAAPVSPGDPAATLPPLPTIDPAAPNSLTNPGFEQGTYSLPEGNLTLSDGWQPFYCAAPYSGNCLASRSGEDQDNPAGLMMERPTYDLNSDAGRFVEGQRAQHWQCPYGPCRAGIYQTFPTEPGQVCEVGIWAQSWSAPDEMGIDENGNQTAPYKSHLKTQDDRDSSTWYVRVDPGGGIDPWTGEVIVSQPFGYEDGIYDQYALISLIFTAEADSATVFFENIRLWPFAHNDNFVDNAFARCAEPPNGSEADGPKVEIGEFTILAEDQPWVGDALGDFVRVGDEIWAYYFNDEGNGGKNGVELATSRDGLTWRTVSDGLLLKGQDGSWDQELIPAVSVLYDEQTGQFQMWYNARADKNDIYSFGIGYATSNDGLHWEKYEGNPVVVSGAPGAWNEERIDGVDVVKVGDTYHMFYTGSTIQPDLIRQIGCETSTDGVHWTPCEPNPVFSPRPSRFPFEGIETEQPSLIYHDGIWLMAYTGYLGTQGNNWRLGLAKSANGRDWKRVSRDPVISVDGKEASTTDPVLWLDLENGLLWLFYRNQGESRTFSVATAPIKFNP